MSVTKTPTAMREVSSCCPNCHCPNVANYCPNCGQEATASVGPVREMALDAAGEFLHWDGKLFATLKGLLRPGFLTTEYLAGRRVAYITPLRLYLWASALYFLVFSSGAHLREVEQFQNQMQAQLATSRAAPPATNPSAPARSLSPTNSTAKAPSARVKRTLAKTKGVANWILENLSTITFLSVPFTALLLHLLYFRQRRYYAAQLITVLHAEAAQLLLTLPLLLIPNGQMAKMAVTMVLHPTYYYLALRRVYGGFPKQGRAKTALKTLLFSASSVLLLLGGSMIAGIVVAILAMSGRI